MSDETASAEEIQRKVSEQIRKAREDIAQRDRPLQRAVNGSLILFATGCIAGIAGAGIQWGAAGVLFATSASFLATSLLMATLIIATEYPG